jgi:hypothetical protein
MFSHPTAAAQPNLRAPNEVFANLISTLVITPLARRRIQRYDSRAAQKRFHSFPIPEAGYESLDRIVLAVSPYLFIIPRHSGKCAGRSHRDCSRY